MLLISTGKKKYYLIWIQKTAESPRRKVLMTFYSIVFWISTSKGHEKPREHELQLLYPSRVP